MPFFRWVLLILYYFIFQTVVIFMLRWNLKAFSFKFFGYWRLNCIYFQIEVERAKDMTSKLERINADLKQMNQETMSLKAQLARIGALSWYQSQVMYIPSDQPNVRKLWLPSLSVSAMDCFVEEKVCFDAHWEYSVFFKLLSK